MDTELRLGAIGVARMGAALVEGVVDDILPPQQIWITDVDRRRVDGIRSELRVNSAKDIAELVKSVDCILCAVEPAHVSEVFSEIADAIQPRAQWVISIAAGVPTAKLESYFPAPPPPIVRVMPNITVSVGAAISVIAAGSEAADQHLAVAQDIFNAVGTSLVMDERHLNAVTGLSGSGPAFVFLFIEALADAGVQIGLSRADAHQLALHTVLGAGKMLEQSGEHPAALKNAVTTPGGTTTAGLYALEQGRLRAVIADAVVAAAKRAEELAN